MTTYYVDINSEYRNIDKYPNPADFGITFKTFDGTGTYPQGLPISSSVYQAPVSIDPDFDRFNDTVYNGTITNSQQIGNNIYYSILSQPYSNATGISMSYNGNVYNNCMLPATGVDLYGTFGLISSVQEYKDLNNEIQHKLNWNVLIINSQNETGYKSINYLNFTINNNDIFVNCNLNYDNTLLLLTRDNINFSVISNISTASSLYLSYNLTFYLTTNGDLGDYAGHNWGYHIIGNTYSLNSYNSHNINSDPSGNIIISENIDPTLPIVYSTPSSDQQGYLYKTRAATTPNGSYIYSGTFLTCSYVEEVPEIAYSVTGAFHFISTTPFEDHGFAEVPRFDTSENERNWVSVNFVENQNGIFAIAGYINVIYENTKDPCELFVFKLNVPSTSISSSVNTVLNNYAVFPAGLADLTNDNIYIACRNDTEVLILAYDSLNNTIDQINNLTQILPVEALGSYFFAYKIDSRYIFFEFPSTYVTETWPIPLPTQETFTFSVYEYVPDINSFTYISYGNVIRDFRNATFQQVGARVIMYVNYYNSMNISIFDITDPNNIFEINILTAKTNQTYNIVPFEVTYNAQTHYCVYLTNGYKCYIMDNPESPVELFASGFILDIPTAYYNEYFYCNNAVINIYNKLFYQFSPNIITSTQYNINSQGYVWDLNDNTLTTSATCFTIANLTLAGLNLSIQADQSNVYILDITTINTSKLKFVYPVIFPSVPKDIQSVVYTMQNDQEVIYITFTFETSIKVYILNTITFNFQVVGDYSNSNIESCVSTQMWVEPNRVYTLLLVNSTQSIKPYLYKLYTNVETNALTYVCETFAILTVSDRIALGMTTVYYNNESGGINRYILVWIRERFIYTSLLFAYLSVLSLQNPQTIDFLNTRPVQSFPSFQTSISTQYNASSRAWQVLLFNSPTNSQYPYFYVTAYDERVLLNPLYSFAETLYIAFDPHQTQPNRPRCSISSFLDSENQLYAVVSGGFEGDTSNYLQIHPIGINNNYIFSDNSISLGQYSNQIQVYSSGDKIICSCLLADGSTYLYDLTNPRFADQYQDLTPSTKIYTCPPGFGSGFIHKILQDGTSDWLTYFGTEYNAPILGQLIQTKDVSIDYNSNRIGIVGNWNSNFQVFEQSSTGGYNAVSGFNDPIVYNTNSFLSVLDIITGQLIYNVEFNGSQNTTATNVSYNTKSNQYFVSMYATNNTNVYAPQVRNNFINPIVIQKTLYATSSSSSFLVAIDFSGNFKWSAALYTNDSLKYVNCTNCVSDDNRVTIMGLTTAGTLKCDDSTVNSVQNSYYKQFQTSPSFQTLYVYSFSLSGEYIASQSVAYNYIASGNLINFCMLYPNSNRFKIIINYFNNQHGCPLPFNKDGTCSLLYPFDNSNGSSVYTSVIDYLYDSSYKDVNGRSYSAVVFNNSSLTGSFENYSLALYSSTNLNDAVINTSFIVRNNDLYKGHLRTVLNVVVKVSLMERIVATTVFPWKSYIGNLSKSNVSDMFTYTLQGNTVIASMLNSTVNIVELSQSTVLYIVYLSIVDQTQQVIPIQSVSYNSTQNTYAFVISSGTLLANAPTVLYLCQFNQSLYWNLQFYPASSVSSQTYLIQIISLTIPNRPLINLGGYGGTRTLRDMPYLYLSVYNVDDNGNYDTSIINVVFDNSQLPVKPLPIFKIPIPAYSDNDNFITLASPTTPLIKFVPGYYNIRFRLLDFNGKPLDFDSTSTKPTDFTFNNSVLPTYMTNVYMRLALTKK